MQLSTRKRICYLHYFSIFLKCAVLLLSATKYLKRNGLRDNSMQHLWIKKSNFSFMWNFLFSISIKNHFEKTGVAPNLKNDSINKIRGICFLQYGFLAIEVSFRFSNFRVYTFFKSQLCFMQGMLIKTQSYIDFEGRGYCSWPFLEDENVRCNFFLNFSILYY